MQIHKVEFAYRFANHAALLVDDERCWCKADVVERLANFSIAIVNNGKWQCIFLCKIEDLVWWVICN